MATQPMQFSDSVSVSAEIERVWDVLNDAQSIGSCIPGLEAVEIYEEGVSFGGTARVNLGTSALSFPARITWVEQNAPHGGRLQALVKLAGFEIEGYGNVALREAESAGTDIRWDAAVHMPEKLAGNPLMVQMARMFASRFIESFFQCLLVRLSAV